MDWTGWQNKASDMINKYGKSMRIRISTQATYNVSSDGYTLATASYPVKGLFVNLEDKDDQGHVTIIENAFILIPAKGLPRLDEEEKVEVVDGSVIRLPFNIGTLQPGGVAITYRLQVK